MIRTCFLFSFLFSFLAFSQKTVVVDIEHPISDDYSYNQELVRALNSAKEEALRKAGIGEDIVSYRTIYSTSYNDDFNRTFSSDALLNIQGTIKSWEYISKPRKSYDEELDNFFINLSIKAKVQKYRSRPDPQFVARINGIRPLYKVSESSDDNLNFIVTPSQECFMKVFYINGTSAEIVYPIRIGEGAKDYAMFKDAILSENNPKEIDYLAPDLNDDEENSIGKLIFVITKKPYDFVYAELDQDGYYTNTKVNKIFEWIMNIEPGDRAIYYEQFSISR